MFKSFLGNFVILKLKEMGNSKWGTLGPRNQAAWVPTLVIPIPLKGNNKNMRPPYPNGANLF